MLWNLQACITEPARIIHYCTRDIIRRLLFNGERERGREKETVSAAVKATGTAEKECPAGGDDEDLNQQHDEDHSDSDEESIDDDDSDTDYAPEYLSMDEDGLSMVVHGKDSLPSKRIDYHADSIKIQRPFCFSRRLVELLAVHPHFEFVGDLFASDFDARSAYYCSSQRGETCRNLDSQDNLILHAEGVAIEDSFYIEIKIPGDDNGIEDDAGYFSFTLDADACNYVITHTMLTARRRKICLTFIPMHTAIQANVKVTLDLISGSATSTGSTIYYVYGEISAHHRFYDEEWVMLFSLRKEDKAEVINGEVPLSRNWAAVPICLEPLMTIRVNLHVGTNRDGEGCYLSLQRDIAFYYGNYEKTICSGDHEVKVQLAY
ncbi:unnamed protein product [Alopecurus aequalis]